MLRSTILLLALMVSGAGAQPGETPNAILLVAKPGLLDPNFRETVVLVTRTQEGQTIGVILNRPMPAKLAEILPDNANTGNYRDAVFFGGPVMRRTLVALFRSTAPPLAPAFPVLKDVYLSMHPQNIEPLLAGGGSAYRLYAGFSGWAPRQLEAEIERDGWFVLAAREELLFRKDTAGLWRELVDKASGARASFRLSK